MMAISILLNAWVFFTFLAYFVNNIISELFASVFCFGRKPNQAVFANHDGVKTLVYRSLPKFVPCTFLSGSFLQTFLPYMVSWFKTRIRFDNIFFPTPDGAILCLDILDTDFSRPLFVCIPGISGNKDAHYIQAFVREFIVPRGRNCIVYNKRCFGMSTPSEEKPLPEYTDVSDFSVAMDYILSRAINDVFLVGFSAGSSTAIKYVSNTNGSVSPKVKAVFSISSGYDLNAVIMTMPTPCNMLLAWYYKRFAKISDVYKKRLSGCCLLQEIDKQTVLRCYMHKSLQEYYQKQSCQDDLMHADVPMFLINSMDDMLFDKHLNLLGIQATYSNPKVVVILTSHGGHVGWFTNDLRIWYNQCIESIYTKHNDLARLMKQPGMFVSVSNI